MPKYQSNKLTDIRAMLQQVKEAIWILLTVNIILERADTLLVQAHHGWEEDGFGARVHLHLPVKSLASEDGRIFGDVTEVRLLLNFRIRRGESR